MSDRLVPRFEQFTADDDDGAAKQAAIDEAKAGPFTEKKLVGSIKGWCDQVTSKLACDHPEVTFRQARAESEIFVCVQCGFRFEVRLGDVMPYGQWKGMDGDQIARSLKPKKPPHHRNPPEIAPQRDVLADGWPIYEEIEVGPHRWPIYPDVVQYEVGEGVNRERLNYPPSKYTHPDPERSRRDGDCSLPYKIIVHRPRVYEAMRSRGWLADRNHPVGEITDHRKIVK